MDGVKLSGVYEVVCAATDRRYVGSSSDVASRWVIHKKELRRNVNGNAKLQKAWNKYGEGAFVFKVLASVPSGDGESLLEVEQFFIDLYCGRGEGILFNICLRAGRPPPTKKGTRKSLETRRRMSLAALRRGPMSEGTKEKLRQVNLGRKASEATKQKMSAKRKGKPSGSKGKSWRLTEETKVKQGQSKVGNDFGKANRGKRRSEEVRRRMSESAKRRHVRQKDGEGS